MPKHNAPALGSRGPSGCRPGARLLAWGRGGGPEVSHPSWPLSGGPLLLHPAQPRMLTGRRLVTRQVLLGPRRCQAPCKMCRAHNRRERWPVFEKPTYSRKKGSGDEYLQEENNQLSVVGGFAEGVTQGPNVQMRSGVRVTCWQGDAEATLEPDLLRKGRVAECGLRAGHESGRRTWIHWGGALSFAQGPGFHATGVPEAGRGAHGEAQG